MVQKGAIKLQYVSTGEQVVDVLTKPLSRVKFEYFCDKLGVVKKYFTQKGGTVMGLQTFLTRRNDEDMDPLHKGGTSQRYGLSSERKSRSNI